MSVAPSATPLLTSAALQSLHAAGVEAISLSLDGSSPSRHDRLRGIDGTFERTLAAALTAREIGLPFQVNTLVCAGTGDDLPDIYDEVAALGAARWSLFFLVSVGRGQELQPVTPPQAEAILSWAAALPVGPGHPVVTTTEAPQFRRIALQQQRGRTYGPDRMAAPGGHSHAAGIRDGNGILFISHVGDVCPSGFMEVPAGNVREEDVLESTERRRYSGCCGTLMRSPAAAAPANIVRPAAARAPAPIRPPAIRCQKIRCACIRRAAETPCLIRSPARTGTAKVRTHYYRVQATHVMALGTATRRSVPMGLPQAEHVP